MGYSLFAGCRYVYLPVKWENLVSLHGQCIQFYLLTSIRARWLFLLAAPALRLYSATTSVSGPSSFKDAV